MNIFILALEPIETRYTCQWFKHLPEAFKKFKNDDKVYNVVGDKVSSEASSGAFLNFFETNLWKNSQINNLVNFFKNGVVKPGDKIFFADAWHSGVIQIKYISELMEIPVEIHSVWHAGSYDSQDFLGRKIKDKTWTYCFEQSVYFASDYNYFATEYHKQLFHSVLSIHHNNPKSVVSGLPFEFLFKELEQYSNIKKENIVLFPHRISPEKQPELFRELSKEFPDWQFIVCQDKKLSKKEYHELLGKAKFVFSANLQETFGISAVEGVICNAVPILPDRLSYSEMYLKEFLYESELTEPDSFDILGNKEIFIGILKEKFQNYDRYKKLLTLQKEKLKNEFCTPLKMYEKICKQM